MNHNFLNIATDSGQKGDAILPWTRFIKPGKGQNGSSKEISRGVWIVHLDASFKYSRHTRGRPARGVSHVQFPCSTTCGVVVHLARDAYLYYCINSISIYINECQWLIFIS